MSYEIKDKEMVIRYLKFFLEYSNDILAKKTRTIRDVIHLKRELKLFKRSVKSCQGLPDNIKNKILLLKIKVKQESFSPAKNIVNLIVFYLFPIYAISLICFPNYDTREEKWVYKIVKKFKNEVENILEWD